MMSSQHVQSEQYVHLLIFQYNKRNWKEVSFHLKLSFESKLHMKRLLH